MKNSMSPCLWIEPPVQQDTRHTGLKDPCWVKRVGHLLTQGFKAEEYTDFDVEIEKIYGMSVFDIN